MTTDKEDPETTKIVNTAAEHLFAVERIDFSQLPRGYVVTEEGSGLPCAGEGEAFDDAWEDFRRRNSPPNMSTVSVSMAAETRVRVLVMLWDAKGVETRVIAEVTSGVGREADERYAKATAWSWYDRRLALANLVDEEQLEEHLPTAIKSVWPRCMQWSDREVAAAEEWCTSGNSRLPPPPWFVEVLP